MRDFEVNLELGSPVSFGRLPYAPTLDSVLASLASEGELLEGADAEGLYREVRRCLSVPGGVPAASALWPAGAVCKSTHVHVRASSALALHPYRQSRTEKPIREFGGKWMLKTSARTVVWSPWWRWWGNGDIDAVSEWLGRLHSVGSKRSCGFGMVASFSVRPISFPAWRAHEIGPLVLSRPVPDDCLDSWLGAIGRTREDIDWSRHAMVPLPRWPAPSWGPGPDIRTVVPLLRKPAAQERAS